MLDVRLAPAATSTAEPVFDVAGDPRALRDEAAKLARTLTGRRVTLAGPGLAGDRLAAVVEGLVLGAYRFSLVPDPGALRRVDLLAGVTDSDGLDRGLRQARAAVLARDLANTPANTKTPAWLAGSAARALTQRGRRRRRPRRGVAGRARLRRRAGRRCGFGVPTPPGRGDVAPATGPARASTW